MLDGKYNFLESEKKWQDFWQENKVYKFEKESSKPIYSIDTPPPTVSGKIHIGHIMGFAQADMIARFKRMQGYNLYYPLGFDNNGLPTELLVEKERKIKAHQLPREEFTKVMEDADGINLQLDEDNLGDAGMIPDYELSEFDDLDDEEEPEEEDDFDYEVDESEFLDDDDEDDSFDSELED